MKDAPEFTRPVRLDTIGEAPRAMTIDADEAECAALARRFGLPAIERLSATAMLRRDGQAVIADGRLAAAVVQSCVATGEPIPASVDEPFALRFEPEDAGASDEVELDEGDLDVLTYSGGAIDLGEAVAETMLLALDPFPRCADADARLKDAGVFGEGEAGQFAALKTLKDKLGG